MLRMICIFLWVVYSNHLSAEKLITFDTNLIVTSLMIVAGIISNLIDVVSKGKD